LFLKVLEYQEYKSTFSKYYINTATVLTFMDRNVLHGVIMKINNVNTLDLTFKKISENSEN